MDTVAILSAFMSFASVLLVVLELRHNRQQRRLDSILCVYEINRELISLGFDHPELFKVLQDAPDVEPSVERRYLQLWLNQIAAIHFLMSHGLLPKVVSVNLWADVAGFFKMDNMRRHWASVRGVYPTSLQVVLDDAVRAAEHEAKK
jgi:hypothetical protein